VAACGGVRLGLARRRPAGPVEWPGLGGRCIGGRAAVMRRWSRSDGALARLRRCCYTRFRLCPGGPDLATALREARGVGPRACSLWCLVCLLFSSSLVLAPHLGYLVLLHPFSSGASPSRPSTSPVSAAFSGEAMSPSPAVLPDADDRLG
jgi:hypothetical protein